MPWWPTREEESTSDCKPDARIADKNVRAIGEKQGKNGVLGPESDVMPSISSWGAALKAGGEDR